MNKVEIREILKQVKYPGFSRDIISFGMVKDIIIDADQIEISLSVNAENKAKLSDLTQNIENILLKTGNISKVIVSFEQQAQNTQIQKNRSTKSISGVKQVIAVASAKGGVGKSTVAVNLAATLAKNYKVGLLDLDIYGPSLPMIIGDTVQPKITQDGKLHPVNRFNMKLMSFGFISGNKSPAIWRGPMVARMTGQFFEDVLWGELDYLILDLPPGTGDIQLTLVQKIALTGAIIVTTPQDLAVLDVKKGADMFKKVNTRVLGIIENMTEFICPHCHKPTKIFKGTGGDTESKRLNVQILGRIPLIPELAESTDSGTPFVLKDGVSPISEEFDKICENLVKVV